MDKENKFQIFQCPKWQKYTCLPIAVVSICIAVWVCIALPGEISEYDDWRAWLLGGIFFLVILYSAFAALRLTLGSFTQLVVTPEYILIKTPVSAAQITWDSVLGVKEMHNGKAFRIIGTQRNIIFNVTDFTDSDYILELVRDKLSGVLNRQRPSVSENVLVDMINLVLRDCPNASPAKVYGKVLSVDRKLKYRKVKQIVTSLSTPR